MSPVHPADVSRWARLIVAKRALILIAVAGIAHLLVLTGVVPVGISEQAEGWTVSIIDAVAAVSGIFWIQSGTTPADPKLAPTSSNGRPLVEVPADAGGHVQVVDPVALADEETLRRDPLR